MNIVVIRKEIRKEILAELQEPNFSSIHRLI